MTTETYKPTTSDEAVAAKTGRTWPEWFAVLDASGAMQMNHKEIVALLKPFIEVSDWWQQMITVEYEKARGLREKHQMTDGYQVSVSKTFPVTASELFQAVLDEQVRAKVLGQPGSSIKSSSANKVVRVILADKSVAEFRLTEKPNNKIQVTVQLNKLANAAEAEEKKKTWKEILNSPDWQRYFENN
ncbi:MAG: DUF4287 domain-containing protein [Hymenobacteraceae bacterium]|nr:DUF4287 domain-containing protein [Hymenobacteraceae bacterium]MDX5397715.1 DUF4287 domain-containing protein [Hymenobacteraceae bacterium]MDX5443594.1 DUF4287 domain-containing protein [Hymenobacteraceae bacterium]MDX5513793.1 DUF4287 domain-containing protein [Hymenobacteraceae bacterium]